VPAPIILALWGVESHYGQRQGSYSIIESLTTLAYDGRRSTFFRKQLLDALKILQQEHMAAKDLTGSWAGAMGQTQFMPSSFLDFAVDFDGDGRKDIWQSNADALASIANYLHTKGWKANVGWGMEVQLPAGANYAQWKEQKDYKAFEEWNRLGVRGVGGANLPHMGTSARLVVPDNDTPIAFLVFPNYDIIMDWNHSIYFATAIGQFADAIGRH
jgi:membrane-bound lytic murein transglycosylase B